MVKVCGVYLIECNGKPYVGSSIDIHLRWKTHIRCLRNKYHCNRKLQNAWNKHGKEKFSFSILEICDAMCRREKETTWIGIKNSFKKGYNIVPVGELSGHATNMNSKPRTAVQRQSSRERMIALNKTLNATRVRTPEWRAARGERLKRLHEEGGIIWTPEARAAASARITEYNTKRRGQPTKKPKTETDI